MATNKLKQAKYERFEQALANAYAAANAAQAGMIEDMGALDCGFAWVVSHDQSFNTFCRLRAKETSDRKYGSKHYGAGWTFWCPGDFNGQSIGIHEAGAKAFADSLAHELQIRVDRSSRLD